MSVCGRAHRKAVTFKKLALRLSADSIISRMNRKAGTPPICTLTRRFVCHTSFWRKQLMTPHFISYFSSWTRHSPVMITWERLSLIRQGAHSDRNELAVCHSWAYNGKMFPVQWGQLHLSPAEVLAFYIFYTNKSFKNRVIPASNWCHTTDKRRDIWIPSRLSGSYPAGSAGFVSSKSALATSTGRTLVSGVHVAWFGRWDHLHRMMSFVDAARRNQGTAALEKNRKNKAVRPTFDL